MQLTIFIQEKKKADGGLFASFFFSFLSFFATSSVLSRAQHLCHTKDMTAPMHPPSSISLSVTKVRPKSILYVAQKEVRETCSLPEPFQIYFFMHQEIVDA